MNLDVECAKMHFIRFKNYIVSNTSLWKYCEFHSNCCVNLVFMNNFENLPIVGFSICSGFEIIRENFHPRNTVSFKSWDSPEMPFWSGSRVKAGDYLRILLRFENSRLAVCFRLNSLPPSRCVYFDYLPHHPIEELYLALENHEMFNEEGMAHIAILNPFEMLTWTAQKKQKAIDNEKREAIKPSVEVTKTLSKKYLMWPLCYSMKSEILGRYHNITFIFTKSNVALNSKTDSILMDDIRTAPICTFCWERPIDVLLMPCNHAVCCNICKDNYVGYERNKRKYTSMKILCPICRKEIESFAQIWFPKACRCLLCADGCEEMSAVAGGENGCGCVIGCYKEARKLCDYRAHCPHCHKKLVKVLQIFVQDDRD